MRKFMKLFVLVTIILSISLLLIMYNVHTYTNHIQERLQYFHDKSEVDMNDGTDLFKINYFYFSNVTKIPYYDRPKNEVITYDELFEKGGNCEDKTLYFVGSISKELNDTEVLIFRTNLKTENGTLIGHMFPIFVINNKYYLYDPTMKVYNTSTNLYKLLKWYKNIIDIKDFSKVMVLKVNIKNGEIVSVKYDPILSIKISMKL